jgi:hypothetical protein
VRYAAIGQHDREGGAIGYETEPLGGKMLESRIVAKPARGGRRGHRQPETLQTYTAPIAAHRL